MTRDRKGIFISYRRVEAIAYAGWLADSLSEDFGEQQVFRDLDSIEPGLDFVETIERALSSAGVVLVVIGKSWLTVSDAAGRQRLQNPDDYVRREIATALQQRNVRVLPVLIQGASMPSADELPEELAPLARRNAFEVHDTSWQDDVRRLTKAVAQSLGVGTEVDEPGTTARDPKLAAVLSAFIPGAGQFYNGRFLDGVLWFGFTLGVWVASSGLLGWVCHVVAPYTAYTYARDQGGRPRNDRTLVRSARFEFVKKWLSERLLSIKKAIQ